MKLGKEISFKDFMLWSGSTIADLCTIKEKELYTRTVKSISTDSRTAVTGDFFIPIKGPSFNGHDFIYDALKKGCSGFVYQEDDEKKAKKAVEEFLNEKPNLCIPPDDIFILKSGDNIIFMLNLAGEYIKQFEARVIGITGSFGKTTTKDLIVNILQNQFDIKYTPMNYNTEIGVSGSILEINKNTEFFIAELGMRGKGQIEKLADILDLDIAAITGIGHSHLEFFSGIEEVAEAKAEVAKPLHEKGGTLFLNNDDGWTDYIENKIKHDGRKVPAVKDYPENNRSENKRGNDRFSAGIKIVRYGENNNLKYNFTEKIADSLGRYSFVLNSSDKKITELKLPVSGAHNIYNACCAAAVCLHAGVKPEFVKTGIENACISEKRMNVFYKDNIIIINDCYNANPDSMKCAIDTLKLISFKNKRRSVALLADMLELGEDTDKLHYQMGRYLNDREIDVLIAAGKYAKYIYDGFTAPGGSGTEKEHLFYYFKDIDSLKGSINDIVGADDVLLIKGSRANKLECFIDLI